MVEKLFVFNDLWYGDCGSHCAENKLSNDDVMVCITIS
jgi:hypothetical protein